MKKLVMIVLLLLIPFRVSAFSSSASSAILLDLDSEYIYYQSNSHNPRPVASISKIMTAIVAIESANLDDVVTVGEEILDAYGSGIYIKVDEQISLRDLLYGLMLRSGNDSALAIAHYVGGDIAGFVEMMNNKAKEIGMKNSTFNNPHGLDEKGGNISTAYDMAILTKYAMNNSEYREIVSTEIKKVETNKNYYSWTNKHRLVLNYDYVTGGKTGFTDKARRTLVTTASKDGINLVAVTLNDGNDFNDHISLFNEVFDNYTNYLILKAGEVNIIGEEHYKRDRLYIKNDISYTLPNNKEYSVFLNFKIEKKHFYNDEEEVGIVELIINDEKRLEEKIYVGKKTVEKISFFKKIGNWFKNLW